MMWDLRTAWSAIRDESPDRSPATADATTWWRAVGELLWSDTPPSTEVERDLKHGPLGAAGTCATATTGVLMESLQPIPRGPQKASVLSRLAQWWVAEFGENDHPEWRAGVEHYRESLRGLRGIGPETADRLLLFAARLPLFPVDRAVLRVMVRHGWLDWPVDDETAQSTFQSTLHGDIDTMQQASRRLRSIGSEFCGRVPNCEACPLVRWLGENGPLHIDEC